MENTKKRLDRDITFRKKHLERFNNCCCFTPSMVPHWTNKKIEQKYTLPETCNKTTSLMIYRKDGNIDNADDDNILVLCKRHYFIVFHELRDMVKRTNFRNSGERRLEKKYVTVSKEEFIKLLQVTNSQQQKILLSLLYYIGGRIEEIILLKKSNIKLNDENPHIVFIPETTKRNVERIVNIPNIFIEPLTIYLNDIEDRLFSFTKQRAWQIVNECVKRAKIDKKIHPHSFRHTYASNVFEETNDLKIVQELLGHKNLATTSIYAHVSMSKKKNTVDNVFK